MTCFELLQGEREKRQVVIDHCKHIIFVCKMVGCVGSPFLRRLEIESSPYVAIVMKYVISDLHRQQTETKKNHLKNFTKLSSIMR